MANPNEEKECAEINIRTCGKVRKMILDIKKISKLSDEPKSQQTIILSILKKEAEKYFLK